MITQDVLNKLYSIIIARPRLYKETLEVNGIYSSTIEEFVNTGILKYNENSTYELTSVEGLYEYGETLIENRRYSEAIICFEKCLNIDKTHRKSLLRIFLFHLKRKEYSKLFELLDKLYDTEEYQKENNLYLFLLNYITPCEERYIDKVRYMSSEELSLPTQINDNTILSIIYRKKILLAQKYFKDIMIEDNNLTIEHLIIQELLNQGVSCEKELNKKLLELYALKQYDEIEILLETKRKTKSYKPYDAYILLLTTKINRMIHTNTILNVYIYDTNDISEAINGNNFELALKLNQEYNSIRQKSENNILTLLIKEAISLVKSINQEDKHSKTSTLIDTPKIELNITIDDLKLELQNQYLETFTYLLKLYLKEKNKEEYEYLIINLLKLSILEGDKLYSEVISVLTEIEENTYELDASIYLQNFYFAISNNKLSIAEIYLNIIFRYSNFKGNIIEDLQNTLENRRLHLESNNETQHNQMNTKKEPAKNHLNNSQKDKGLTIETESKVLLDRLTMMKERHESLVVLKSTTEEKRNIIYEAIKTIPELQCFTIGETTKNIVLRYINPNSEKINIVKYISEMKKVYWNKQYLVYIRMAKKLLAYDSYDMFKDRNYVEIFAMLGKAYMITNNRKEAIKCLTIAHELNNDAPKRNNKFDFEELIKSLRLKQSEDMQEEKKTNPLIYIQDFDDDLDDNYGIKCLEVIDNYIKIEKLTIEEACKKMGLSENKILLVKLIYARDYYIEGDYINGDKLLLAVEKSKNKSKTVLKLLNEIRTNKQFYKHRTNAHTRKRTIY